LDSLSPGRERDHVRWFVWCAQVHAVALVAVAGVVVADVLVQDGMQVAFTDNQHSVRAFGANCADEPLSDRVHPWCLRCGFDGGHVYGGEHGVEYGGELGVPVPDQVCEPAAGGFEIGGEVLDQLRNPVSGRVPGDAQKVYPAAAMLDDERHVQSAQTDCTVHVKGVCGQNRVGVGAKERAPGVVPGVRWWDGAGAKDLADGGRADAMPKSAKLALDADDAPGLVFPGQLYDQLHQLR
jgi:hypothetical protein